MFHQLVIDPASVYKCRFRLRLRSGYESTGIARRIEHEGSRTRENVGTKSKDAVRNGDDEGPGGLMHVSLDIERPSRGEVLLRIAYVAVAGISSQPMVEVIAITYDKAACICRVLVDFISAGVFGEETRALNANLMRQCSVFLRHRC